MNCAYQTINRIYFSLFKKKNVLSSTKAITYTLKWFNMIFYRYSVFLEFSLKNRDFFFYFILVCPLLKLLFKSNQSNILQCCFFIGGKLTKVGMGVC